VRATHSVWLACLLIGCAPPPTRAPGPTLTPPPRPERAWFELGSHLWLNLHQRLFAETNPARWRATAQAGADSFTPDERAAWDAALDLYRKRIPQRDPRTPLSDELVELNQRLANRVDEAPLTGSGIDDELNARLTAAAAVYRAHGWPEDDRTNRAWIAAIRPSLQRLGGPIARDLSAAFAQDWPAAPIRVEVSVHAGILGAYTAGAPPFITITSSRPSYQGDAALEMLFHEASHVLVGSVEAAIAKECAAQNKPVPDTLWHAVLFYTAGEIVRRRLGEGYVPYAYKNGLYERSPDWKQYETLLKLEWQKYLDGKVAMPAAVRAIVAALS
jgi:hypothetical protein